MHSKPFVLVFFIIFVCCVDNGNTTEVKCPEYIIKEFKKYKNHKQLIGIAKIESSCNPKAKNGPCWGLGQINTKVWAKELIEKGIIKEKKDLFKVKENIKAMAYILKHYKYNYDRYRGKRNVQHRSKK